MASVLDDINITLNNGDLEVFKQWVEAKLESKDKQIEHLLHKIQTLEIEINILNSRIENKLDKVQFDYEMTMRYEN
jgi:peptidoglycan hydrolase CwlO-like protein